MWRAKLKFCIFTGSQNLLWASFIYGSFARILKTVPRAEKLPGFMEEKHKFRVNLILQCSYLFAKKQSMVVMAISNTQPSNFSDGCAVSAGFCGIPIAISDSTSSQRLGGVATTRIRGSGNLGHNR